MDKGPATDDSELVARSLAGDRKAFEALVHRYQGPVYNAAYRITGSTDDASDVAQTVFMKVAAQLSDFDGQHKFFSWIYRIAVNESINLVQKRRPEDSLGEDSDAAAPESADPAWAVQRHQMADRIHAALRAMATQDRIVLTLRHFSECSYEEIGQILALEPRTVKSRLFEARRRLGERLVALKAL